MGLIENVKEAVKLVQQIDNIELYTKILELQTGAMELVEQFKKQDELITQLKEALSLKGKLVIMHSAYFLTDDNENVIDGPFCTKCFDVDHLKCRIIPACSPRQGLGRNYVQCPKCKVPFESMLIKRYLDTGRFKPLEP